MPKFILQHHYQSLILLIFMYVFHSYLPRVASYRLHELIHEQCSEQILARGVSISLSPGALAQSSSSCSAHVLSHCSGSGQGSPFGGFYLQWFTALASQSDRCGWGTGLHHLLLATGRMSLHSMCTPPKQQW